LCGIGERNAFLADGVKDDEVAESLGSLDVRDGWERNSGEFLVSALDSFRRETQFFGGLGESKQIRADPVGAGQIAHLLHADGNLVVQRDCRQSRGAAIALVFLPDAYGSFQHSSDPFVVWGGLFATIAQRGVKK
jgi:hypothetical protein